ncbi:inorganic diphosphatase [bacterium]|nr:inorganic diphosphatase [bacterium]
MNVVVDVPKGSNNKYEYDHELGCFRLDRVIHSSMYYPVDYGFIPQTLSGDGDPCDVCLLVTNPTFTGCIIKARPIGILYTFDNA